MAVLRSCASARLVEGTSEDELKHSCIDAALPAQTPRYVNAVPIRPKGLRGLHVYTMQFKSLGSLGNVLVFFNED